MSLQRTAWPAQSEALRLREIERGSAELRAAPARENAEGSDTVEKRIAILHYVLLVLSLVMVVTSVIAFHELSQITADGDAIYAQTVPAGPGDRATGRSGQPKDTAHRSAGLDSRPQVLISNFASEVSTMTIYKSPYEQFGVSLDFSSDIGAGNTVTSISAVTAINNLTQANSTAEVIAAAPVPSISSSGTAVAFQVTGGVVGESHLISVQIVTSVGEKHQEDVTLRVVE